MEFIGRVMDSWAEGESPELEKLIWSLYGPLLRLGCIFPSWKPGERAVSVIWFIWYFTIIVYHGFLMVVSVYLELENLALSSLILHYLVFILFGAFSVTIFQFKRSCLVNLHTTFFIGYFFTHCSGRIYEAEEVKKIQKMIDSETFKLVVLPTGLVGIISILLLIGPYIKNFNREVMYTESGVSTVLPFQFWYPYDTHYGLVHLVTVGLQFAMAGSLAVVAITDLLMLFRVSQKIRFEYKVLSYALSSLLDRASQMYVQQNRHRPKRKEQPFEPVYQHYVGLCLRDCVRHHIKISEMVNELEDKICWQVALAYVAGTAAIGLSLINVILLWQREDYENVALFAILMTSETINMFMISAIGEAFTTEGEILRKELYFMNWYEMDIKNRRLYRVFQTYLTEPVVLTSGILMDVRLDTFTTIINSAYSFFNLMNVEL